MYPVVAFLAYQYKVAHFASKFDAFKPDDMMNVECATALSSIVMLAASLTDRIVAFPYRLDSRFPFE